MLLRGFHLLLAFALLSLAGGAQAPTAKEEASFLARDTHQGVSIAARPIPDTPEAERVFGKNAAPTRAGFLPVELLIRNDREEPIEVALERIVVVSGRDEFEQAGTRSVALWLYPPPGVKEPKVGGPRLPIPWPRGPKAPKDKHREKREEAEASLRSRLFRAEEIAPGARARGFLYFDLRDADIDLARAYVYVPEVNAVESGEGLLFYEVSLEVYAQP
jgi:hypothetical protein